MEEIIKSFNYRSVLFILYFIRIFVHFFYFVSFSYNSSFCSEKLIKITITKEKGFNIIPRKMIFILEKKN